MRTPTLFYYPSTGLALFIVFTRVAISIGTTVERTIDDTLGDSESGVLPVYEPANAFSFNSKCTTCTLDPDPASAFQGTWHDSSQFPGGPAVNVTLSFEGTAISVFCILSNNASKGISNSDFVFMVDGVPQKSFTHLPDNTSDFVYQAKVLDVAGLNRGTHKVVMATDNSAGSLMLFDFARYTFDDGIVSSPSVTTVTNTVISISTASHSKITRSTFSKSGLSTSASSIATSASSIATSASSITISVPSSPSASQQSDTGSPSSFSPSPSPSSPPNPSLASASAQVALKKQIKLAPILAGTLIPIAFFALAVTILCRRLRTRYAKEFEETRVHSPEAGWFQLNDPVGRAATVADIPGVEQNHFPTPGKRSRWGTRRTPPQAAASPSVRGEPELSRAPTFRTFDVGLTSPPPGYELAFQQQQLVQASNVSGTVARGRAPP
ncbi:hypothetical protein DFH08DRAFT_789070 [Mycena albidolilacea]|uniref:Transmembrane protein n=1 Tax=Mycena albidolilacea TaxID=1033008 RepID=A0AAD6ZFB3_9AGAR|nr:hypothetical protein DFH08DRAFT_789070 [Mycena albidolilacea]